MTEPCGSDLEALTAAALPAVAGGQTAARWLIMSQWARTGAVGTARLAEAHHDAYGILHEATLSPNRGTYAVWASQAPSDVIVDRNAMTITGTKHFCSGIGIADRALIVAADASDNEWLLETTVTPRSSITTDLNRWHTPALADTATGSVTFEQHPAVRIIGEPGWYLTRPGFWHGAIGPAACWAGAALGLVDTARTLAGETVLDAIGLGELTAEAHLLVALLRDAGDSADANPHDQTIARQCAYSVRHLVERSATRIADTFSRTFGPRPFVASPATTQRCLDLHLYLRQEHGLRDLATLGAMEPR